MHRKAITFLQKDELKEKLVRAIEVTEVLAEQAEFLNGSLRCRDPFFYVVN
jgi:hypothetical protein